MTAFRLVNSIFSDGLQFISSVRRYGFIMAYLDVIAKQSYEQGMAEAMKSMRLSSLPDESITTVLFPAKDSSPQTIFIIPCLCNTFDHLQDLHLSLKSLESYPVGIVVCIDGPTPFENDLLALKHSRSTLILLKNSKRKGAAFSRNKCLDQIESSFPSANWVCMMDCGVQITALWWKAFLDASKSNRTDILCGFTKPLLDSQHDNCITRWMDQYYLETGVLSPRVDKTSGTILYAPTCNLVIPKRAFHIRFLQDIFPDAGFEDVEYCLRCQKIYHIPISYIDELQAFHHFRSRTLDDLRSRFQRYGRNHVRFRNIYSDYETEFNHSLPIHHYRHQQL